MGALFINAKKSVHMQRILNKMGHPQPCTPIQMDNSTVEGVINSRVCPKHTKLMDMRFKWLLDRVQQGQFLIYWKPGKTNFADYFTRHHPPAHHCNVQGEFLTQVAKLHKLHQEQAIKNGNASGSARETGLATTDGIICKGVLTYQDMCLRLFKPNQNTV